MLHNYHTHTTRCGHALGSEREYIENAIENGFQTLGFSDHGPYVEPVGFLKGHRVPIELTAEYFSTIRALKKEYEKDIRILCGVELEYYPETHAAEMAFLKEFQPDYLLLGQHFVGVEKDGVRSHAGGLDERLTAYVSQVLEGLATGDFLYLAHPDMAGYNYSDEAIEREYLRLCEGAKALDIPLEINLLGVRDHRWYPDERLFKIAAGVGNKVVFGLDAHTPEAFSHKRSVLQAEEMVKTLGLNLVEKPL